MDGIGSRPRLRATRPDGEPLTDRAYPIEAVPDVPAAMPVAGAWLRERQNVNLDCGRSPRRSWRPGLCTARCWSISRCRGRAGALCFAGAAASAAQSGADPHALLDNFPTLPQVACFDTAFHRDHGALADHYAIPHQLHAEGVRRYGFHGLSYEYIAKRLPQVAPDVAERPRDRRPSRQRRLDVRDEGWTQRREHAWASPRSTGLPMGTRPGQLDPGVVLYLIAEKGMSASNGAGFSLPRLRPEGSVGRQQRHARTRDQRGPARGICDRLFRLPRSASMPECWRPRCRASMLSCSPRESARIRPTIRARIAEKLAWLGVALDPAANARHAQRDLPARQPHPGLRHTDRRGADDCAAYPVAIDEEAIAQPETRECVMNIPVFPETKVALKGKKGLIVGIANDQSIAWGCAKAFRALGADLAVTYLNEKAKKHVEPLAKALEAPIFMPLDVMVRRRNRKGVRADREGVGPTRLPASLDRIFAEGRAARPCGRCRPRRLSEDHGCVLLVLHADGASGRAADEERRHPVHHDLLRQPDGREELQRHGRGEGGARSRGALHRGRARPERHSCPCHFAGTAGHARGFGHPGIRRIDGQGAVAGAGAQPGQHRRRRQGDRVPRARWRQPDHRRRHSISTAAITSSIEVRACARFSDSAGR